MGCCSVSLGFYLLGAAGLYFAWKYFKSMLEQRKLDRWKNTPKDVVILHAFPPATTLPNGSPFVLKVQTYLRMAKIKHEIERDDFLGPKGKSPWITLNGTHVGDSELIVQFLNKKFEKKLDGSYTQEQLALAASVRIMLEEHAFWGLALDRFVHSDSMGKITKNLNLFLKLYIRFIVRPNVQKQAWMGGVGRHSQEEIVRLITNDLQIVSKLLGSKKFILGDQPCVDDCAIFGFLANCLWGLPGSPYERLVNGELSNLKEYCLRMKERFYPDWEQCLQK